MSDMFEQTVPVALVVPYDSVQGDREAMLSDSLRAAAEAIGYTSLFHIWSYDDYERYSQKATGHGRNIQPIETQDSLAGLDTSEVRIITAYNISNDEAEALCRETNIRFIQSTHASTGAGSKPAYGFLIMSALEPQIDEIAA